MLLRLDSIIKIYINIQLIHHKIYSTFQYRETNSLRAEKSKEHHKQMITISSLFLFYFREISIAFVLR